MEDYYGVSKTLHSMFDEPEDYWKEDKKVEKKVEKKP